MADTDGFEIKRSGDQNVNCQIILHLDYSPEKYKLAPELSKLLNVHTESKAAIIMAVWQYIKVRLNKIQILFSFVGYWTE